MRYTLSLTTALLVLFSTLSLAQAAPQTRTLVVNGHSGEAPAIQYKGRVFVDLAALANIGNGSLAFNANQIVLTLPLPSADNSQSAAPTPGLSHGFMNAAIEEIALIREWAAPLGSAIQNGYPITDDWVTSNQQKAADGLRSATVAASTDDDRSALQLLTNEFEGVRKWSDKMLKDKANMNTGKYAMSPGSLREEPLAQKLITCWQFLSSMLVSGSFQDDSSCH